MAGEACVPKGHYHLKLITVLYHCSLGREARWIMTEEVRGKWAREQANGLEPMLAAPSSTVWRCDLNTYRCSINTSGMNE